MASGAVRWRTTWDDAEAELFVKRSRPAAAGPSAHDRKPYDGVDDGDCGATGTCSRVCQYPCTFHRRPLAGVVNG